MVRFARAYALAAVVAAAALGGSRLLWPLVDPSGSPLFLAAVVVSAWYGGLGPGLFTTTIAVLTKMFFVMPPRGSFQVEELAGVLHLAVFAGVAVLISFLTGALRRAEAANRALVAEERAARAEAEAANRAKDVFLAKISHELRTPLQATSSWAHVLARLRSDDLRFAEALTALHRGIATQSRLIDDLLAASKIVAGKMRLDVEPVALGPVIDAAVETATAAAPVPQPTVGVTVVPSVSPVLGDRARLEQVVCNLLSNALKFTPPDGSVQVRVEQDDTSARIVVADTGCGIRPDVLPRLFEEFWQAGTSGPSAQGGLGLGLAIVRHLVELHGGSVSAESGGPGRGTTFVVALPLADTAAEEGLAAAAAR
jgi:signal transduction histidine kinase